MIPYLYRAWRRLRHAVLDHVWWTPFDDGHLIGHATPPKPTLHLVDRGGLGPRDDDGE